MKENGRQEQLTIRLPGSLLRELEQLATKADRSLAAEVRRATRAHIQRERQGARS